MNARNLLTPQPRPASQEMPELADLIRERGGYDALDVLRKTKQLLKLAKAKRHAAKKGGPTDAALAAITDALRDELMDMSIDELVQRAEARGVDPAAVEDALAAEDAGQKAAQLAELVLKAIEESAAVGEEDLLDSMSTALRSELARLPAEELARRAVALGIDPESVAHALHGDTAAQIAMDLASLIVDRLIWNANHATSGALGGKMSEDLRERVASLLSDAIESGALDALLLIEPDRIMAAVENEERAAMVIQRHARGKMTRTMMEKRVAKHRAEVEERAKTVAQHNSATRIQRHYRGCRVRKQIKQRERLMFDVAKVVLRQAARAKVHAIRKRKEKRKHDWASTKIQAWRRGYEARKLLHALQTEGVDAWVASGHTRSARRWFERFSGTSVDENGWLRRDQLHRLVIELRSSHGLPIFDAVVEREVREMMDGSWDQAFRDALAASRNDNRSRNEQQQQLPPSPPPPPRKGKAKLYQDKLSFPRWLQIIRAAEKRVVPLSAPPSASRGTPKFGWSNNPRWAIEYPEIRGGDAVFPKMAASGRCAAQNRYYPVGLGPGGCEIPAVGAPQAPGVMRKPLADALWTWCGESHHFVHNNHC